MVKEKVKREGFSSRLGFILISAGCAIGLGNVWKFPYQVGKYGGAVFLLLYLICIVLIALPLMSFEFAVGRASRKGTAKAFEKLEPANTKWHHFKWASVSAQYILMFFYTTVCGWMLNYIFKESTGMFEDVSKELSGEIFKNMITDPGQMILWMVITVLIGMIVCAIGVQKGVEKITKIMMAILIVIMCGLAVFAICQPGGAEGLKFFFMPDFTYVTSSWSNFTDVLYSAMSQAFFTLSVGAGTMVVFGSYINKERALFGEAVTISILDTLVGIVAGLIIFPTCFASGVRPDSGPSLIFETLPNVFSDLPMPSLFGAAFFIFLSFAALSTVIAVFENIIMFWVELKGWSRKKSVAINLILITACSIPCCLGFSVLSGITLPALHLDSIMDIEDFIISNNLLPLGGVVFAIFCTVKKGWGWKNAITEINTGKGLKLSEKMRLWVGIGIPVIVFIIFIFGWISALTK